MNAQIAAKLSDSILEILARIGDTSISQMRGELRDLGWRALGSDYDLSQQIESLGFTVTEIMRKDGRVRIATRISL